MKKIILSFAALCFSTAAFSQITLLNENFDSFPDFVITGFGNWQTLDLDFATTYTGGNTTPTPIWDNAGEPMAFQIFNPSTASVNNNTSATVADPENRNFDPHSGAKFAASWAAAPDPFDPTTPPQNNDWLISPAIQLGGSGNSLEFWVKSLSSTYGLEKYKVGVYIGSGTPTSVSDFTIISGAAPLSAPYVAWEKKTFPLNYPNQTVRIAIQNVSSDVYMLMVDDVKISATTLGTNESGAVKSYSLYPNPTKGAFSIKSADKIAGIRIYDATGKLVLENRNSNKGDITEFPTGVYYMNIAFADGTIKTEKLIKE